MNPEEQDERAMLSNQDAAQDTAQDTDETIADPARGGAGPQTSAMGNEATAGETAPGGVDPAEGVAAGGAPLRPSATDVQAYIGRQLRAVYDDVVKQPIPDRFLALMKQLEDGGREP